MATTPQIYTGSVNNDRAPATYDSSRMGTSMPPNGGEVSSVGPPSANEMATVTMLSPDGKSGDVPISKVADAQKAGFKVAVQMKSPDGLNGYVSAENVHDAAAKGFKMVPIEVPDAAKVSYWDALTNPVGSGGAQQGIVGGVQQIGGQAIKALAQPVLHPIDTVEGLYNTVRHPIQTAQGIGQQVQADYQQGGVPLAAENLAGQAIGAYEGGRIAAPVANAALNTLPTSVGRAVLLGKTPEAAYESALKPSTTIGQADRAAMVQTGLQNAIPVSKVGVEKLGDLIDDLNSKIKGTIAQDPARLIDPNAVATRIQPTLDRFSNQVVAQPDLNAIEATRQQFLAERGARPGTPGIGPRPTGLLDAQGRPIMSQGVPAEPPQPAPPMSAADAQAMKQGTYGVLKGKFGEQGSATVEAQKALARGLKEEIATQFPEISNLNSAEGKLLDLQPVLERAVNRISNHQVIGIGTPVAGAATTAVTGSTTIGKVAMVAKAVLDNPNVKSHLAIAVSKGAKIPYAQALARVQSYATSLGSASSVGQENSTGGNSNQPAQPQQ
jgi:hypothetical protein